ncbi:MAG: PorP/SprF family type IX secretion system membrane protein, partial [Chitinophagales bacterium]
MKKILLYIAVFIFSVATLNAQDIHFTNYNAQPLVLNPAMTGMNGCDWRVGANFRTQWLGVSEGNTYRTVSAFADIAVGKPTKYSNFGGVGLSFFSDQAGDLNYNTNRVDLSFAYHFIINKKQSISAGIQGAFIHRSFNQSKALYEFDPITGEPVLAAAESFDASTKMYGDANLGFLYSIEPKKNTNYYIGIALHHLNQPNISSF